ncbi:hypothetical protein PVK06_047513 [Gossypium arboreum]|uniref:Uncharacterized protein n=1 Tax=Gossypium arboreum TaxID=29729 RepID=A0ABR0MDG9_GOSAR|nr:hypothetical protein PVK06_047513 [Gossypium arboreum]
MHILRISCGECIITLEDMQLRLGLEMDGHVVIETVHTNWKVICDEVLRIVSKTIFGGRIEMAWLRRIFGELDKDSTEVKKDNTLRLTSL